MLNVDPHTLATSLAISLIASLILTGTGWLLRCLFRRDKAKHLAKLTRQRKGKGKGPRAIDGIAAMVQNRRLDQMGFDTGTMTINEIREFEGLRTVEMEYRPQVLELPQPGDMYRGMEVGERLNEDVIVLKSPHALTDRAAKHIREAVEANFPGRKVIILEEGLGIEFHQSGYNAAAYAGDRERQEEARQQRLEDKFVEFRKMVGLDRKALERDAGKFRRKHGPPPPELPEPPSVIDIYK